MYFVALVYLFLGVAISADVFMASIEVITAKVYEAEIINPDTGLPATAEVEVWNATVANLTLMALGSSAPEILLAVVECVSMSFEAGDLGPGTIVGSAAFNLLIIIAICCVSLDPLEDNPDMLDVRKIEEFGKSFHKSTALTLLLFILISTRATRYLISCLTFDFQVCS